MSRLLGKIITFYSYKGGTGRTMALANLAILLAKKDDSPKVLIIDWDLEAPGLHRYFEAYLNEDTFNKKPGLINFFDDLKNQIDKKNNELTENVLNEFSKYVIPTTYNNLFFCKSGIFDDTYSKQISQFDWNLFYQSNTDIFLLFSEILKTEYDYILIDSRTGLSDTSGICTAIMPEVLLLFFIPNKQNIEGVLQVAETSLLYRMESNDTRPIKIIPVPSRIESGELKLRESWRKGWDKFKGYQKLFEDLFAKYYQIEKPELEEYFDQVQLQHIPRYSYGEAIAVLDEIVQDNLSLTRTYEILLQKVLDESDIWEQKSSSSTKIYFSYQLSDRELASSIALFLRPKFEIVETFYSQKTYNSTEILSRIKEAGIFIPFLSQNYFQSENERLEFSLIQFAIDNKQGTMIPIVMSKNLGNYIPLNVIQKPHINSWSYKLKEIEGRLNDIINSIIEIGEKKSDIDLSKEIEIHLEGEQRDHRSMKHQFKNDGIPLELVEFTQITSNLGKREISAPYFHYLDKGDSFTIEFLMNKSIKHSSIKLTYLMLFSAFDSQFYSVAYHYNGTEGVISKPKLANRTREFPFKQIDINEAWELDYWSHRFQTTVANLKEVVIKQGNDTQELINFFNK